MKFNENTLKDLKKEFTGSNSITSEKFTLSNKQKVEHTFKINKMETLDAFEFVDKIRAYAGISLFDQSNVILANLGLNENSTEQEIFITGICKIISTLKTEHVTEMSLLACETVKVILPDDSTRDLDKRGINYYLKPFDMYKILARVIYVNFIG